MKLHKKYIRLTTIALMSMCLYSLHGQTEGETAPPGAVKVGSLKGNVTLFDSNTQTSAEAVGGQLFAAPTTVIAGGDANMVLFLSNGAMIIVPPGGRFVISEFTQEPFDSSLGSFDSLSGDPSPSQVRIRIITGELIIRVGQLNPASHFIVETPSGTIRADDRYFVVGYNPDSMTTEISNLDGSGSLDFENGAGTVTQVPPGQTVTVPGQADPSGNVVTGQPIVQPNSPSTVSKGDAAQEAGSSASGGGSATETQPTTPPTGLTVTPDVDLHDLIEPTSIAPSR